MIKAKNLLAMVSIFTNIAVLRVKIKINLSYLESYGYDFQFILVEMYIMYACNTYASIWRAPTYTLTWDFNQALHVLINFNIASKFFMQIFPKAKLVLHCSNRKSSF